MTQRKSTILLDEGMMKEVMRQTMKVGTGLVSTKEVAKRVGLSESALFVHFKTKADLMDKTFVYAWKSITEDHFFDVGEKLLANQPFDYYKDSILSSLAFKKELAYCQHYLASTYCHRDLVEQTWEPTMQLFLAVFKNFASDIPEEDCRFLARMCVGMRINIACLFILENYPLNEANLKNAFTLIDEGLVQAVGAYRPETLAKIRRAQADRFDQHS
jgi:AcrR family transcriptional regulator